MVFYEYRDYRSGLETSGWSGGQGRRSDVENGENRDLIRKFVPESFWQN
jgi:hypothetical protein